MLQLNFIREERQRVEAGLRKRNWTDAQIEVIGQVIALDDQRRKNQAEYDNLKGESNQIAKKIGILMQQGERGEADALRVKVTADKETLKNLEANANEIAEKLENLLYSIPNIPNETVPHGKTPDDNEIYQPHVGALPVLPEGAKPHWELADQYGIFDLALGVKIAGAGFPVYRGKGARLQRALINFFLDEAIKAGYEEVQPPHLVNEASARGTGNLPDKEGQMYHATVDDLYLIPTAEVPVTNIWRDVILAESDFPVKATAYTPCFRREAGSYGAHVRGLNRVHQFDKIEIVQIAHPDQSYDRLQEMLAHVSQLLEKLELPYRILKLCGGDMGFTSALTYDFEVWSAAQERWLEVSSTSNFETYQTNRLKARFRDADGKIRLAHSLNGSALALPRIVASLLENHQTPEGIRIPKALQSYFGAAILD
ncbi:MAG: hypothetical protein RL757_1027 [Bacteroidota bacterium]|jgi:seryl-tRNA synthetase